MRPPSTTRGLLCALCFAAILVLAVGCSSGGSDPTDPDDGGGGGGGGGGATRPGLPTVVSMVHPSGLLDVDAEGEVIAGVTAQGVVRFVSETDGFSSTAAAYLPMGVEPRIEVEDGLAYIAAGTEGLCVFRVSETSRVRYLNAFRPARVDARAVWAAGRTVMLADHGFGLRVLSTANPSTLAVLGAQPLAAVVSVTGSDTPGRAYAGTDDGTIVAYDASRLGYPEMGRVTLDDAPAIDGLAAYGTVLLALVRGRGLLVLNAAVPARMEVLSELPLAGAERVILHGESALVACRPEGAAPSVHVVSVADPLVPVVVASYEPAGLLAMGGSDTGALLVDGAGFVALNVTDPAHPAATGRFTEPGAIRHIAVHGGWALAATADRLLVVDDSDPRLPKLSTSHVATSEPLALAAADGLACALLAAGSLAVIDTSQVAAPPLTAEAPVAGARAVALVGTLAYVALGEAGVDTIDLTIASAPVARSHWAPTYGAGALTARGGLLYLAESGTGRLHVVQPDAEGNLTEVGTPLTLPGVAASLEVVGTKLLASCGASGLAVVSLAAPQAPKLSSSYTAEVDGATLVEETAYAACGALGLRLIWTGGPEAPEVFLTLNCAAAVNGVTLDRGTLFLATDGSLLAAEP